ncbi:HAMP domain-containing histidine kinase [Microcoleus sp. FACHB-1515]|uniref:sensor histidine kinase n=1 Tax=Cyanophyceae TaxID=3028117 RepID=UPI00168560C8|nr:HAMP domain-containing sensor histidine kinase [Microcoleus sp. FACHB-1515]MBD2092887.1 HAMP domain-containing histidine kinase [Microcoleus sp. FACHB-1515]
MYKWYLPTLSELIEQSEPLSIAVKPALQQQVQAERRWYSAIAALHILLQETQAGVLLAGPVPILEQGALLDRLSCWTFTPEPLSLATWMPFLPPADRCSEVAATPATLPLLADDPQAGEQFCVVLTPSFSVALAFGEGVTNAPAFRFSFDPDVVWQAWRSLRSRLLLAQPQSVSRLDVLVDQFQPIAPDYRLVTRFSHLLLTCLPDAIEWESTPASAAPAVETNSDPLDSAADVELLQAIAHEVRTPLATIRTLTRLLLKRQDLSPDVLKRLKLIDQECTKQIDRFGLIFRAVELETTPHKQSIAPLGAISLTQVFEQNIARWQQTAMQRGLTLDVSLPQKLPLVVSDSAMLDQVLTGLIDRITQTQPPGGHIQLEATLAGHQLKLQFQSQPDIATTNGKSKWTPTLKSIGQLLMFQPETGNLSLNLSVTKNLFQALGGKLIVRERPQQGEVMTIFLPLETRRIEE